MGSLSYDGVCEGLRETLPHHGALASGYICDECRGCEGEGGREEATAWRRVRRFRFQGITHSKNKLRTA